MDYVFRGTSANEVRVDVLAGPPRTCCVVVDILVDTEAIERFLNFVLVFTDLPDGVLPGCNPEHKVAFGSTGGLLSESVLNLIKRRMFKSPGVTDVSLSANLILLFPSDRYGGGE